MGRVRATKFDNTPYTKNVYQFLIIQQATGLKLLYAMVAMKQTEITLKYSSMNINGGVQSSNKYHKFVCLNWFEERRKGERPKTCRIWEPLHFRRLLIFIRSQGSFVPKLRRRNYIHNVYWVKKYQLWGRENGCQYHAVIHGSCKRTIVSFINAKINSLGVQTQTYNSISSFTYANKPNLVYFSIRSNVTSNLKPRWKYVALLFIYIYRKVLWIIKSPITSIKNKSLKIYNKKCKNYFFVIYY